MDSVVSSLKRRFGPAIGLGRRIQRALDQPMQWELERSWVQNLGLDRVLDVGANEGQFAHMARRAFPLARIVSFEPLADCHERLTAAFAGDTAFEAHRLALAATPGERAMYRSAFSPSSSLLPMAQLHEEVFPHAAAGERVVVPISTLDDALGAPPPGPPRTLLKIDVQGSELDVLRGGTRTLNCCALILMEVSFGSLYQGEPTFAEVIRYMAGVGFSAAGFAEQLRRPKTDRPLQADLLFVPATERS
jgi:FkbM family methyltransferase